MSVVEYHCKFAQLSRYAPNEVADDANKQRRFLKGLYDGLQLQLMSNTYPNFQTLVNRAIVIDNKRKDRPLGVILVHAPTLSKASNRGTRDHLISGVTTRTSNVHCTSNRMAINVPNSRVAIRHYDREHLITLP